MARCPKCEAPLGREALVCRACGTPCFHDPWRADPPAVGAPLMDPRLRAFEKDPPVRSCPNCLGEFVAGARVCRKCGERPLVTLPRSRFQKRLLELPVHDLGERLRAGLPPTPADLMRVAVMEDLEQAQALAAELTFLGIETCLGSDTLDPFPEFLQVGVYVHRDDEAGARYGVAGFHPRDPLASPPEETGEPRLKLLERARGYLGIGKLRGALMLLEQLPKDVEAHELAVQAHLLALRLREASKRALQGARQQAPRSPARGRLFYWAGVALCLGPDGTPFGQGADLERARDLLQEATELAARFLSAWKALVEVAQRLQQKALLRRAFRSIERLNPNLLSATSIWRRWKLSL